MELVYAVSILTKLVGAREFPFVGSSGDIVDLRRLNSCHRSLTTSQDSVKSIMDKTLADSYIGKYLLVGITYVDHNNDLLEQRQFHGHIVRINEEEGIVVKLHGSDREFKLPLDLNSLQVAPQGEYRLRDTGEVVVDPDFLTTWTVTKTKPEDD